VTGVERNDQDACTDREIAQERNPVKRPDQLFRTSRPNSGTVHGQAIVSDVGS
jgi:hypothetical protein